MKSITYKYSKHNIALMAKNTICMQAYLKFIGKQHYSC
jgi:hypothetical protein